MDSFDSKLYWYQAKCINVVDGDTVDLEIDLGLKLMLRERIRLYGVDTPEIYSTKKDSQEYKDGMVAKARVSDLILGKIIWVNTMKDKQEKYGRYLGIIYVKDAAGNMVVVNDILLAEGLAKPLVY